MKHFIICLSMASILFFSCVQNPTNRDVVSTTKDSMDDIKNTKSIQKIDSFAIGNIKMGCSPKEIETQKKIFIKQNKRLGDLVIEHIAPFFVDNQLAEVTIYSERYSYSRMLVDRIYQNSNSPQPKRWRDLYDEKYTKTDDDNYKKGFMTIEVSDEMGDAFYDLSVHHKVVLHRDNKVRSFIRITDPRLLQLQNQRANKERKKELQRAKDII